MDEARQGRQRTRLTATEVDLGVVRQRALLVGVVLGGNERGEAEVSLDELAELTTTAGSEPVEATLVRRARPDTALFIGKGKAEELARLARAQDIDVVIFDNQLSPAQQKNLEKIFACDVVDRIALILDIFAQHASSRAGMYQVELAQLRYRLPRLRGRGVELSRLGGGIGTRGPGETQLETDRRRILTRIRKLERELKALSASRATQRKARAQVSIPTVSIVGYTNAGKSTLFNRLTDSDVLVEDQLFATLDSTVRRLELPAGHLALISDTVGFVRRLPHELVEAFRSTLEEVVEADLLLHVVDGADAHPDRQIESVRVVLEEIGAAPVPELLVINKTDIAPAAAVGRLARLYEAVPVSARTGEGLAGLMEALATSLKATVAEMELIVPYDQSRVVAEAHAAGEVVTQEHTDAGTRVVVRLPLPAADRFRDFRTAD